MNSDEQGWDDVKALEVPAGFAERCALIGVEVSDEELERLGLFLALLLETNKKFNLTGIKEPGEAWERHVLDGLSVLAFLAEGVGSVADVGSGGGVPGLVLAIVKPGVKFTLIEATGKKARFLEAAAKHLGLENVEVVCERAETAGQDEKYRETFDVVVARAVGPMRVLLELTLPLVRVKGRLLAMKGKSVEGEMGECGNALLKLGGNDVKVYETMPAIDGESVMVVVKKWRGTQKAYPRNPGMPKAQPL